AADTGRHDARYGDPAQSAALKTRDRFPPDLGARWAALARCNDPLSVRADHAAIRLLLWLPVRQLYAAPAAGAAAIPAAGDGRMRGVRLFRPGALHPEPDDKARKADSNGSAGRARLDGDLCRSGPQPRRDGQPGLARTRSKLAGTRGGTQHHVG